MTLDCPLCQSTHVVDFEQDKRRRYFRCEPCSLVFADPASRLSPKEEEAVYQQHENEISDEGYRRFLGRLADPLLEKLGSAPLEGLDFGCGPGPALAAMLEEAGHKMVLYDPYFMPDHSVLGTTYDFVTCTEAIEHFYMPHKEWGQLLSLVKPGGWLAIMTKLVIDVDAFKHWHYKNDPTHVSFFSRETFCFLAGRDGLDVDFVGNDVILLRKKNE
ncbi:2-polyprenyl-3-methyl-5-hydroxy-6-metoxy-1,4-benzoquinol methylase [Enterovibrio norvegicus FF-33]|uniref:class I SAM-dependent methyltransferase n=1 Tax=Enterovibrio norvegicus TaxID=188144 RepID=UPI0002FC4410|nr:class I SAM-dependent methyltransferase [Enterovibrio norvegicus]OEE71173.1 2-polyprenyl-3-methyl-5-hydroxy-6-metoxy-1,4-benzoquinol methylase [Enterovibrio norvegicus FF-33]OEE74687.1 2-polyprenyl-3-methyl-5-hydroxy-6-metoxy-1,4-benzoquinol methylase [Enterovibrio norvegicus FF-162]